MSSECFVQTDIYSFFSGDFETTYNFAYVSPPSTPSKTGKNKKYEKSTPSPKRSFKNSTASSIPSPKRSVNIIQEKLRTRDALIKSEKLRNISAKCDNVENTEFTQFTDPVNRDTKFTDLVCTDSKFTDLGITDGQLTDLVDTSVKLTDSVDYTDLKLTDSLPITDIIDIDYNGNGAERNAPNVLTESDEFNSNFKSTLNVDPRIISQNRTNSGSESGSAKSGSVECQSLQNSESRIESGLESKPQLLNCTIEIRSPKRTTTCKPSLFQRLLNFHSKSNVTFAEHAPTKPLKSSKTSESTELHPEPDITAPAPSGGAIISSSPNIIVSSNPPFR